MSVVVVGSINLDLTVPVSSPPAAGQTLLGGDLVRGAGGKGANQAVALARLGRDVQMIGAVGQDPDGTELLARLQAEGVEVSGVRRVGAATGQAFVFISPDGDSTIVVAPGANMALDPADARGPAVVAAEAVLLQQEVPAAVVAAAVASAEGLVVLNPAPARPLDPPVLAGVDVLIPNRDELAVVAGVGPLTEHDAIAAAARGLGVRGEVLVTMGAAGSLVVERDRATHVPAARVDAVDATAAGDSYCAAVTDALLHGADVVEAARFATAVAAVTVTRAGAMDSLPRRAEVRG